MNKTTLLSSHELLDIFSASHVATAIYTTDALRIEAVTDAMLAFWGKDRSIIGLPLAEAVPEMGKRFIEEMQSVWATGKTITGNGTPATGRGVLKYFDYEFRALRRADGTIYCLLHTTNEVTERVQGAEAIEKGRFQLQMLENEQALNEELQASNEELTATNEELDRSRQNLNRLNEELEDRVEQRTRAAEAAQFRMQAMVMNTPIAMAILRGHELVVEVANQPMLDVWRRTIDQVVGRGLVEIFPELKDQPNPERMRRVMFTGQRFSLPETEVILGTVDGVLKKHYARFSYDPIFEPDGSVASMLVTVINITDEVNNREELKRAYEQARLSKDAAQLGTFDMDLRSGNLHWDERCRTLFGISHQDTITYERDFVGGLHADDKERVLAVIATSMSPAGKGEYDVEYRTVGAEDQHLRWIRAKGRIYFDKDNTPERFIGSVLDITEQKLNELRKNDFIGMVSHELKTPLTSLTAMIQVAEKKLENSPDKFLAGAMQKAGVQVKRMSGMINGFLNISRLESADIHLDTQTFDLQKLIADIIAETQLTVSSHSIHFEPGGEVMVHADKEKINSVITNLIGNAIKYSPKGKSVDVECTVTAHEVKVSVRDQGMGIKASDLDKIFDRYYRVESRDTKHISGFGIGLYLSAEIVHRHEGHIWAESIIGLGSVFSFTLPLG